MDKRLRIRQLFIDFMVR